MDKMREIPKKLLEKYGIRAQRDKLQEEHGELIEAIKKNDRSNVVEEIADCTIVFQSILTHYSVELHELSSMMLKKIEKAEKYLKD